MKASRGSGPQSGEGQLGKRAQRKLANQSENAGGPSGQKMFYGVIALVLFCGLGFVQFLFMFSSVFSGKLDLQLLAVSLYAPVYSGSAWVVLQNIMHARIRGTHAQHHGMHTRMHILRFARACTA